MRRFYWGSVLISLTALCGAAAIAFFRWDDFLRLLGKTTSSTADESHHQHEHSPVPLEQVKLSPQAQANLRITSKPLRLQMFWKTIQLPGQIMDRPGFSDRGVVAPITGVVTKVHRLPGDTVRPGDGLFTIRLLSESMQLAQTELFKASKDTEITLETKQRLDKLDATGSIAHVRIIELENQLRRLGVTEQAYRLELQTRGLTPTQIDSIASGKFVTESLVTVPPRRPEDKASSENLDPATVEAPFEMQELKVELGQQVQAGQTLCLLSHHESLYIEGRGFRKEVPLLEKAVQEAWPLDIEFSEDQSSDWPKVQSVFSIRNISNTVDPASRTFSFYIPLVNQSRSYEKDGRTFLLWRFRPGQRVRIHIREEKLENVFVLPSDAVVREGPATYVFRQNGDLFDRRAVHVLYQDQQQAVVANDGSIQPGIFVAKNAATQLNRVLKTQGGTGQPNVHVHADGTVHANH